VLFFSHNFDKFSTVLSIRLCLHHRTQSELKVGPGFLGRTKFRLKFIKMFRDDFGPASKFFRNDGHFCRQLLLKQSS